MTTTESFRGARERNQRAADLRAAGYCVREWENMDLYAASARFQVSYWRDGSL